MELRNAPILNISTIDDVPPLNLQYGVGEKLSVPLCLENYFNQEGVSTYVLVDASSIEQFHNLLLLTETKYEILLGESKKEEYKSVATYLFDLEQSKEFLTWLFTQAESQKLAWCLAESQVGVFLQSECELGELAYYFKKFIRLRDDNNKWRYFRFADPEFFKFMLNRMQEAPEYCCRWFYSNGKHLIDNYSIYQYGAQQFTTFRATNELQSYQVKQKPLLFDDFYQELSEQYYEKLFSQKIISIISNDFPEYYQGDASDLAELIIGINRKSQQLGLKSELARGQFIIASVLVGRALSQDDLSSVGFYAEAMEHENRKTKKLLEQVINNIKRRSLDNGD